MVCLTERSLIDRLRLHINAARRLSQRPRTSGLRRFERGDYEERPLLGNDSLILRAGGMALDVRYVLREPGTGHVWKSWQFSFAANLTACELYRWLTSLR